jgi:hypothetical protein
VPVNAGVLGTGLGVVGAVVADVGADVAGVDAGVFGVDAGVFAVAAGVFGVDAGVFAVAAGVFDVGVVFETILPQLPNSSIHNTFVFKDTLPIIIDNESTANIIKNKKNGVILKFILLYSICGKIILSKNEV